MKVSTRDVEAAIRAARASARRRSTLCLGVSSLPPGPDEDGPEPFFFAMNSGSLYGVADAVAAFELTYGPVAVNLVASAAERDMMLEILSCPIQIAPLNSAVGFSDWRPLQHT